MNHFDHMTDQICFGKSIEKGGSTNSPGIGKWVISTKRFPISCILQLLFQKYRVHGAIWNRYMDMIRTFPLCWHPNLWVPKVPFKCHCDWSLEFKHHFSSDSVGMIQFNERIGFRFATGIIDCLTFASNRTIFEW